MLTANSDIYYKTQSIELIVEFFGDDMKNEETYKKVLEAGLLGKDMLDYCWVATYSDERFAKNQDLAEVLVQLGYLNAEQIEDLFDEDWDFKDDLNESIFADEDLRTEQLTDVSDIQKELKKPKKIPKMISPTKKTVFADKPDTLHDYEDDEDFSPTTDARTLLKVDTGKKYKVDYDDDNQGSLSKSAESLGRKVPRKIERPQSSRVKKISGRHTKISSARLEKISDRKEKIESGRRSKISDRKHKLIKTSELRTEQTEQEYFKSPVITASQTLSKKDFQDLSLIELVENELNPDKYSLHDLLGEGGMGAVFLAKEKALNAILLSKS